METTIKANAEHPGCFDLFRGEHRVMEAESMTVCENVKGHLESRPHYIHSECAEVAEAILRGERLSAPRCSECSGFDRVLVDGMGGEALCWDCRHGADGVECNAEECTCDDGKCAVCRADNVRAGREA